MIGEPHAAKCLKYGLIEIQNGKSQNQKAQAYVLFNDQNPVNVTIHYK